MASIAQLAGVDALGLISTILQAAQTVRHNRETCQELVQDLQIMEDLLKLLREPDMMRQEKMKNVLNGVLNGLDKTLREAGSLVQSCQDCSVAYRIFMGWKQSDQFNRVKKKMAKHLKFYGMISHADLACRIEQIGQTVQSAYSSQQDAQETRTSSTSSQFPEARNQVGTPVEIEIEAVETEVGSVKIEMTQAGTDSTTVEEHQQAGTESTTVEEHQQAGTKSTTVEEHQQAGNNENNGSLATMKWRSRLKLPLLRKKCSRSAQTKGKVETPSFICELTGLGLTIFQFDQLCTATDDFSSRYKLEDWGSRDHNIYKGRLPDGLHIMIERRPPSPFPSGRMRFQSKVEIISKLQHMNIVRIIGCCTEREEELLVYEYMTNGRLIDVITGGTGTRFLDWSERFKIIIGITRGLLYVHKDCGMYIAHWNLSSRSILLDADMAPKITNFDNAVSRNPNDSVDIVLWSDVCRFGIIVLEIITAKSLLGDDISLLSEKEFVQSVKLWTLESTMQLIDPALRGETRTDEIMRCIQIALLCIVSDKEHPLSMWDVLLMLSCESAVIPAIARPPSESTQHLEASGSGTAHHDAGELSDSDVVEPR